MIVVPQTRSLHGWRVALTASGWALAVNAGMRLVLLTSTTPSASDTVYYLVVAGFMVLVPLPWVYSRIVARRIFAFVTVYSVAVVTMNGLLSLLADGLHARLGNAGWLFVRGGTRPVFVNAIGLLVYTPPLTLLAWCVLRWIRGPVREQDGTLCPGCGYCLVGATVPVCLECGRGFSVAELGQIEPSPALQKRLGIPIARPAQSPSEPLHGA